MSWTSRPTVRCALLALGLLLPAAPAIPASPAAPGGGDLPTSLDRLEATASQPQIDTLLALLTQYCDVAAQLIAQARAVDPQEALALLEQYSAEIEALGEHVLMLVIQDEAELEALAGEVLTTVDAFWNRISSQAAFKQMLEDALAEGLGEAQAVLDMNRAQIDETVQACLDELLAAAGPGAVLPPPSGPGPAWADFADQIDDLVSIRRAFTTAVTDLMAVSDQATAQQLLADASAALTETNALVRTLGQDLLVAGRRAGLLLAVQMTSVPEFDGAPTLEEFDDLAVLAERMVGLVVADAQAAHEADLRRLRAAAD